jgi:hypothetical protein
MDLKPVAREIRKEIAKLNHILRVLEKTKVAKQVKTARRKISAAGRWKKIRAGKK